MRVTVLSGDWTLSRIDEDIPLHAVVPGSVQTDLIAAGRLEDPVLTGDPAPSYAECGYKWRYARSFILPLVGMGEKYVLVCEGLDTFASIYVNGICVGKADNAFRVWKYDITDALQNGSNKLEIVFDEKKDSIFLRSPHTPSTGIWRGVYLQTLNGVSLSSVVVRQIHFEDSVTLEADVSIDTFGGQPDITVKAELYYKGSIISETQSHIGSQTLAKVKLDVRNPQLWWPRTMGEQPLYELAFTLISGSQVLGSWSRRIGFRTISLNRTPDANGDNFEICVNGVPVKIYGTGWNFTDMFPSRPTRVEYAKLIKSVSVANMNLIRVRGTCAYEHDHFYDLCDEYGIMVWQDLPFANSAYPVENAEWRKSVLAEVRDNADRLSHHASLVLWCGNDELPLHFVGAPGEPGKMPLHAYKEFFGDAVRKVLEEQTPGVPYIESSVSTSKNDNVLAVLKLPRKNRKDPPPAPARFYTSFGMNSLADTNGQLDSETDILLQKHFRPLVNTKFKVPISQIAQGLIIKSAVENLRRCPQINNGVVFSTLFNPIDSFSESSLARTTHWKCLHYFARRFFSDILISAVPNPKLGTVEIFVHNNAPTVFRGKLKCRMIDTTGIVWREMETPFETPASTVKRLGILKLTDLLQKVGPDKMLVWIRMVDGGGYSPSSDCIRFAAPRALALEEPGITCDVHKWDEHCYAVTLNALRPTLWCWLELPLCQAKFDDNFICLAPGQPMRIRVTPSRHIKQEEFKKGLVVHSLYDTYKH